MGSISTLSGTLLVTAYYWAHYNVDSWKKAKSELRAKLAFFQSLNPICSNCGIAIFTKISGFVVGNFFSRTMLKFRNFFPKFLCYGGSKSRPSTCYNSKPEVEIEFVPTAFNTVRRALKRAVNFFRQVAPQVPWIGKVPRPLKFQTPFSQIWPGLSLSNLQVVEHSRVPYAMQSFEKICSSEKSQGPKMWFSTFGGLTPKL